MGFTKKQISNFINDEILFRFSIGENNLIKFDQYDELFTFDELEKVVKSNFEYWDSLSKTTSNNFASNWRDLNNKVTLAREYLSSLEELELDNINNQFYYHLSNSRQPQEEKMVYILSIDSPIDKDLEIRKIKSFISFYIEQTTDNLIEAIRSFIYLYKNNHSIGNYLSNSAKYQFYPAFYMLRKKFSNIRENLSDFESSIVDPLTAKLNDISNNSDEQYREITSFIENKHNEIQKQFDEKSSELDEFQDSLNKWQKEKQDKFNELEETYKNKLSLEAPEELWKERAKEHRNQARNWTIILVVVATILIIASASLVNAVHDYSQNIIKQIPFISESFILISVISFFIYIVRILVKIVMSNHHLATEYNQKAALTRFYQALTYAGTDIDKDERLIIINALFSRVETGLVKTDNTSDSDALLAVLSKNIK